MGGPFPKNYAMKFAKNRRKKDSTRNIGLGPKDPQSSYIFESFHLKWQPHSGNLAKPPRTLYVVKLGLPETHQGPLSKVHNCAWLMKCMYGDAKEAKEPKGKGWCRGVYYWPKPEFYSGPKIVQCTGTNTSTSALSFGFFGFLGISIHAFHKPDTILDLWEVSLVGF